MGEFYVRWKKISVLKYALQADAQSICLVLKSICIIYTLILFLCVPQSVLDVL